MCNVSHAADSSGQTRVLSPQRETSAPTGIMMVAQRAPNWAIWKQLPKRNTYLKAVRIRRSARCRAKNRVTVCNQGWSAPARKYPPFCTPAGVQRHSRRRMQIRVLGAVATLIHVDEG